MLSNILGYNRRPSCTSPSFFFCSSHFNFHYSHSPHSWHSSSSSLSQLGSNLPIHPLHISHQSPHSSPRPPQNLSSSLVSLRTSSTSSSSVALLVDFPSMGATFRVTMHWCSLVDISGVGRFQQSVPRCLFNVSVLTLRGHHSFSSSYSFACLTPLSWFVPNKNLWKIQTLIVWPFKPCLEA